MITSALALCGPIGCKSEARPPKQGKIPPYVTNNLRMEHREEGRLAWVAHAKQAEGNRERATMEQVEIHYASTQDQDQSQNQEQDQAPSPADADDADAPVSEGKPTVMIAERGKINMENDISRFEVVEITTPDGVEVVAPRGIYAGDAGTMTLFQGVTLTRDRLEVQSQKAIFQLDDSSFTMPGEVEGVIFAQEQTSTEEDAGPKRDAP